jgi:hypothetical protein
MSIDGVDLSKREEKCDANGFAHIDSVEASRCSYVCRAKGAMLQVRRGRRIPYLETEAYREL